MITLAKLRIKKRRRKKSVAQWQFVGVLMGVLAFWLILGEYLGSFGSFCASLWEFFEHRLAYLVISLKVIVMNRSRFIRPFLERFRKAQCCHSLKFCCLRQMGMSGHNALHQYAEVVVATLMNEPAIHQHATGP